LGDLEDADWPVPDHRAGTVQASGKAPDGGRSSIQHHPAVVDGVHGAHDGVLSRLNRTSAYGVDRQLQLAGALSLALSRCVACCGTFGSGSTASSSTRLAPTCLPSALKKVLAMAPPSKRASTRGSRKRSTPALLDTLAPPTMATRGRRGSSSARCSAASSASI